MKKFLDGGSRGPRGEASRTAFAVRILAAHDAALARHGRIPRHAPRRAPHLTRTAYLARSHRLDAHVGT